jgi:hypothetical protein
MHAVGFREAFAKLIWSSHGLNRPAARSYFVMLRATARIVSCTTSCASESCNPARRATA